MQTPITEMCFTGRFASTAARCMRETRWGTAIMTAAVGAPLILPSPDDLSEFVYCRTGDKNGRRHPRKAWGILIPCPSLVVSVLFAPRPMIETARDSMCNKMWVLCEETQ